MNRLDYLSAIVLGLVQGIAEFLPISSSGHLAVTQKWLQLDAESPEMLLYDVMTHMGSVVAVLLVFRKSTSRYLRHLVRDLGRSWKRPGGALTISYLGMCALIPTAVLGLAYQDTFEAAFGRPVWIGIGLLISGTLLAVTRWIPAGRRGWRQFAWWQAAVVGVVQGLAIFPGISRSGSTICVASYLGLRRRWAAEFSFFIAIPAICGATAIKIWDTIKLPAEELTAIAWGPVAVGTVVSMVSGVAALLLLLGAVRRGRLYFFALYCWVAGVSVILGWDEGVGVLLRRAMSMDG